MKRINTPSNREKILMRIFKMYVNKNIYDSTEYHAFCKAAKGKSEASLLQFINI